MCFRLSKVGGVCLIYFPPAIRARLVRLLSAGPPFGCGWLRTVRVMDAGGRLLTASCLSASTQYDLSRNGPPIPTLGVGSPPSRDGWGVRGDGGQHHGKASLPPRRPALSDGCLGLKVYAQTPPLVLSSIDAQHARDASLPENDSSRELAIAI